MRVGVPKEIKSNENRVGLVPGSVRELVHHGHSVIVETNAGYGIGFDDDDYRAAGATIGGTAAEVFAGADMIVKVKEPQAGEIATSLGLTPSGLFPPALPLADPAKIADANILVLLGADKAGGVTATPPVGADAVTGDTTTSSAPPTT